MSKYLTSDEIEAMSARSELCEEATFPGETVRRMSRTLQNIAQRLADSPCPVCCLARWSEYLGPGRMRGDDDCPVPCPHCGTFPPGRRGKAYESKEAAIDSLEE
uniref:Uncharacterized protein n=1 Tax=viral metagenome TaxID=1070528 RepID=A0A6M3XGX6_9ZZZZ